MSKKIEIEKLTKAELIERHKELQEEYDSLEQRYNDLDDCYAELEGQLCENAEELEEKHEDLKEKSILDLDKFKRELETQGLLTDELREFIDRYMQFDNHE